MAGLKSITQISAWRGQAGIARLSKMAPILTSLALIGLIAWVLADLLWALTSPAPAPRESQAQPDPTPMAEASASEAARGLFGTWDESAPRSIDLSLQDTVETSLPLSLVGVFVSDAEGNSGAIISSGQGQGIYYGVGEPVPGNALLESVDNSGVMLRRGARIERLSFPQADSLSAFVPRAAKAASVRVSTQTRVPDAPADANLGLDASSLGEKIQEYRAIADNDPDEALSQLGLARVSASEVEGYRVGDLPDNQWIRQTGLQDGDILLSVNGHRIGNPELDRLEIDNFIAEGQVRLEIRRGERRFFVNAKLSP